MPAPAMPHRGALQPMGRQSAGDLLTIAPRNLASCFFANTPLAGGPGADRAATQIMTAGGAVLSTEVDDLQMQGVPAGLWEERFEIPFGLHDIARRR